MLLKWLEEGYTKNALCDPFSLKDKTIQSWFKSELIQGADGE